LMAPVGQRPEDIFAAFRGSCVSAAHNLLGGPAPKM
jgi:hypothetical protein